MDADVWGTLRDPLGHAQDIIQIIPQPEASPVGKVLQDKLLPVAHLLPRWLQYLIFWSKSKPDRFEQCSRSIPNFENFSLIFGNVVTSIVVYVAVTSLYFDTGKVLNVITTLVVTLVTTICSIFFRNQQFVVVLTAYVLHYVISP